MTMAGLFKRLFKSEAEPVVTIVSGLPRSGTSMMMKMLEAGGIPPVIDEIREADSDNPKGYYEFERVKQMDKGDTKWLAQAPGKAVKVISALLCSNICRRIINIASSLCGEICQKSWLHNGRC